VRAKPGMARRAEANAESVAARLFSRREKSEPKNQNGATRGRRAHDVRAVAALFTGREARATRVLRRDRETMGNTVANALNLPATLTRMMMFEGANLDEAMTAQAFADIEAAVGIPGIADHYQRALERYHFKQRKDAAGAMRPEDYLTMGSTYLWRNAEYNKDLGVGLQVAETVGGIVLNTVGNIIPGVGTGIWLAYNALKQSYMGSLKGGTRGAIAGYMSAGLTAFTSQFGVSAGLSYSYEDGWGGQVGVTLPIGDTSLSGSAGINFQEGEGITGTSVGAGYNFGGGSSNNPNTGYQGGIGLSFDQYGDFAGGNLNFGYGAQTQGGDNWYNPDVFNVGGSLNFDRESFTGIGLNASGTNLNHLPGGLTLAHTLGGGLTFNFDGSFGVNVNQNLGYNNAVGFGINGLDATNNGSFWWDEDGEFQGVTNSITLGADWQSQEDARRRNLQEQDRLSRLIDAATDPDERAKLGQALNDLRVEYAHVDPEARLNAWQDRLQVMEAGGRISADDRARTEAAIIADPTLMDSLEMKLLVWDYDGNPAAGGTREGWLSQAFGAVGDGLKYVFGMESSEHGFVDEQGNYHERTCFVAGTPVTALEGQRGIEGIRAGDIVQGYDEVTGKLVWARVQQTFMRTVDRIYRVILANGVLIETTWSHRFAVEGEGWVEARKLRIGDELKTSGFDTIAVSRIEVVAREATVYNFSVEGAHTYFVSTAGVLVHNDEYTRLPGFNGAVSRIHDVLSEEVGGGARDTLIRKVLKEVAKSLPGGVGGALLVGTTLWDSMSTGEKIATVVNGISSARGTVGLESAMLDDPMRQELQHLTDSINRARGDEDVLREMYQGKVDEVDGRIARLQDEIASLENRQRDALANGGSFDPRWGDQVDQNKRDLKNLSETVMLGLESQFIGKRAQLDQHQERLTQSRNKLLVIMKDNLNNDTSKLGIVRQFDRWVSDTYANYPAGTKRAEFLRAETAASIGAAEGFRLYQAGKSGHDTVRTVDNDSAWHYRMIRDESNAAMLNQARALLGAPVGNWYTLNTIRADDPQIGRNVFHPPVNYAFQAGE
jgi:uncharacterized small protein (DUF1192 family)